MICLLSTQFDKLLIDGATTNIHTIHNSEALDSAEILRYYCLTNIANLTGNKFLL